MRDLIRKILEEHTRGSIPDWYKEFDSLSTEERIDVIKKRKKQYEKLIPTIVDFFKETYGGKLEKIEVVEKGVHYGHEYFSLKVPNLIFYFNEANEGTKWEIRGYLINLFGIEFDYYGIPFDYEVLVKSWNRI